MKHIEIDEDYEDMDMPVVCDCGQLFDLHDGYGSNKSNKVICESCHKKEDLEEQIEELESTISCMEEEIKYDQQELLEFKSDLENLKKKLNNL